MINFALFGAGRIGVLHAANIAANHSRARLSCVYDTNAAAAEQTAAKYGARVASSVEAALDDAAIDAVLIASSTDTHVDLITASARAGKAILCEKPIDLDIERVERCRRDIAGTGVPVQIAFNRRYDTTTAPFARRCATARSVRSSCWCITSRDPGLPALSFLKDRAVSFAT